MASRPSKPAWPAAVALSVLLALIALSMTDYRFAAGDQLQYFSHVVELEHPGLLASDPYLRAFEILRSVFWQVIAAVSDEANLPVVCLVVAIAVAAAAALLLMRLGTLLTSEGRRGLDLVAGTATALVFVVPKETNWFGLVLLADVELTATSAVIPLVIGSMLAWTAGRPVVALLVALAVVPLHAQTAAYLLSTWLFASLWSARRSPRHLILPGCVGVAGLLAVLQERAGNAVASEHLAAFEHVGRTLYPELIDPWSSPWSPWAAVLAILALGAAAAVALVRRGDAPPARRAQRAAIGWAIATLVFPLVGMALLAAGVREPILWRLMVGRSFMLPQIAALVLFAAAAVQMLRRPGASAGLGSIALLLIAWWPFPEWPPSAAAPAIAAVITVVALEARGSRHVERKGTRRFAGGVVTGIALFLTVVAAIRFAHRPYSWLEEGMSPSWREAQQWARANTAPGTRFLTPPHHAGWRIGAHRPTYGELYDGGLFFYAGEESLDWAQRMEELGFEPVIGAKPDRGGPAFAAALAQRDNAWFAARGIDFAVTERAHDVDIGVVVWSNPDYVIRRVTPRAR